MGQPAVVIPEKIFFKIGEVCDLVGVQAHVLRYWETEFPMLSPQKNRSGQRSYRRRDVEIALNIKELLYEDLYTIAGAKKKLQSEMRDSSRLKIVHSESGKKETYLREVKSEDSEENLETNLEDLEIGEIDEQDKVETIELDEERQEALTSLTAQLLELREMLKQGSGEKSEAI
jgi:DNA-binding transcriptional MerR regulator